MDMNIYVTEDYSEFKKLGGNRNVEKVKAIIESINKIGYRKNPIIVNEKMEVIDGQHRLEALRILGLPVLYVIDEGAGIEECIALNQGQKNWGLNDYMQSYAYSGSEDYERFISLIENNKKYKPIVLDGFAHGTIVTGGKDFSSRIKSGSYSLSPEDKMSAEKTCKFIDSVYEPLMAITGEKRTLLTMIGWALKVPNCNEKTLYKTIWNYYPIMFPPVDLVKSLIQLSDLYNKNAVKKIQFDYYYRGI